MGVGVMRLVKLVLLSESAGTDGPEATADEVANIYATINFVRQSRQFEANRGGFVTEYEMLVRYASEVDAVLNINCMIEYNNRRYSISAIERGDVVKSKVRYARIIDADSYSIQFTANPEGRWWRLLVGSNDIS
jgi:head-tail adaptor